MYRQITSLLLRTVQIQRGRRTISSSVKTDAYFTADILSVPTDTEGLAQQKDVGRRFDPRAPVDTNTA